MLQRVTSMLVGTVILSLLILIFYIKRSPDAAIPMSTIKLPSEKTNTNMLLPDLVPTSPAQLYVQYEGDAKILRFSTTFINAGIGPLHLEGEHDYETETTRTTQTIRTIDGEDETQFVGEFMFHPTHDHWHIEDYVIFQLWSLSDTGEKADLLASTDKMSFCIWDEHDYDLSLESAPAEQIYLGCNEGVQGISVGWADTYEAEIDGQILDISAIPDGRYLVLTHINLDEKIHESDYSNNEDISYIEISGNSITKIDDSLSLQ